MYTLGNFRLASFRTHPFLERSMNTDIYQSIVHAFLKKHDALCRKHRHHRLVFVCHDLWAAHLKICSGKFCVLFRTEPHGRHLRLDRTDGQLQPCLRNDPDFLDIHVAYRHYIAIDARLTQLKPRNCFAHGVDPCSVGRMSPQEFVARIGDAGKKLGTAQGIISCTHCDDCAQRIRFQLKVL